MRIPRARSSLQQKNDNGTLEALRLTYEHDGRARREYDGRARQASMSEYDDRARRLHHDRT